jgi:hypothetical protein
MEPSDPPVDPRDPGAAFRAATEAVLVTWADLAPEARTAVPAELRRPLITLVAGWLQDPPPADAPPAQEDG